MIKFIIIICLLCALALTWIVCASKSEYERKIDDEEQIKYLRRMNEKDRRN